MTRPGTWRIGMKRDKIILKGMTFYGYHGVSKAERKTGQRFYMDIEMTLDLGEAGKTDKLSKTIDYTQVYSLIKEIQSKKKYHLMESLAEDIANAALDKFDRLNEVTVKVRKPHAPIGGLMEYVEVEINRLKKQQEPWRSRVR